MVNTRQFSGSTYMQDMTKSHTFSAKNQGSTYTPIRLIRREIRYFVVEGNTNIFACELRTYSPMWPSQKHRDCFNLLEKCVGPSSPLETEATA